MRVSVKSALLAGAVCFSLAGQALADGPVVYNGYKVPKDSLGHPDLNGSYKADTLTPLQRMPGYGNRMVMTEDEVAKMEGRVAALDVVAHQKTDQSITDLNKLPEDGGLNYSPGFLDSPTTVMRVHGQPRSSLVTTPDGFIPPDLKGRILFARPQVVQQGVTRKNGIATYSVETPEMNENPEGRDMSERCLIGFSQGLFIHPGGYDGIYTIQQSRDAVAIQSEVIHVVRIARLNSKHRTDGVKTWEGDSIAWYEGNTLVVETTGFDPRFPPLGAVGDDPTVRTSDQTKVTERFTRVSPTLLHYAFTVEDPKTWAKPWGGEYEMPRASATYEYACHEGNYGLEATLAGARYEESQAKQASASAK